jgi:hypothetical protein
MQREMDKRKKQRLERAGWTAGSARDFLELSDKEAALLASVRMTQKLTSSKLRRCGEPNP